MLIAQLLVLALQVPSEASLPDLVSLSKPIADCRDWERPEFFWLDDKSILMDRQWKPGTADENHRPLWQFDTKSKKWSPWGKLMIDGATNLNNVSPNGRLVVVNRWEIAGDKFFAYFAIRDRDGNQLGEWPIARLPIGAVARLPSDFTTWNWLPDSSGVVESYLDSDGKTSWGQSELFRPILGSKGVPYPRSAINRDSIFNPTINSEGEFVEVSHSPWQPLLSQVTIWPAEHPDRTSVREISFPPNTSGVVALPSPDARHILWLTGKDRLKEDPEATQKVDTDIIWLSNRDGSGLKQLAKLDFPKSNIWTGWSGIAALCWKPNGKSISFVADRRLFEARIDFKKLTLSKK